MPPGWIRGTIQGETNSMSHSSGKPTRRGVLQGATAALAAAYGFHPEWARAEIPLEYDGSKFQMAPPEPNPKRGGVLRYGITNRPPHFDFHQSGTINSLGAQGCMFDNLIRRDPRDSGKTIVPDLAHSWEIAKDGKTYTFHLRKGVLFHDGAELTSDDVKATFDRIRKPPAGVSIPRSTLFATVAPTRESLSRGSSRRCCGTRARTCSTSSRRGSRPWACLPRR